jgi:Co/Zn/Cd efflux system component
MQGVVLAHHGALVSLFAERRIIHGSVPHPFALLVIGAMALAAHFSVGAIVLSQRRMFTGFTPLWRLIRADAVGNIAVIAAALTVAATRSNIPDLVIGAAMAAFFFVSGWKIAITGRLDAGRPS